MPFFKRRKKRIRRKKMIVFTDGQIISVLEKPKTINFNSQKTIKPIVIEKESALDVFQGETSSKKHSEIIYEYLRKKATKIIIKKAEKLAENNNLAFNMVRVKHVTSRWGSCSSKKNLNFNWMLLFTSEKFLEYVIIHELAHLKHMNHSKDFWKEVERMMPEYTLHRRFEARLHEKNGIIN